MSDTYVEPAYHDETIQLSIADANDSPRLVGGYRHLMTADLATISKYDVAIGVDGAEDFSLQACFLSCANFDYFSLSKDRECSCLTEEEDDDLETAACGIFGSNQHTCDEVYEYVFLAAGDEVSGFFNLGNGACVQSKGTATQTMLCDGDTCDFDAAKCSELCKIDASCEGFMLVDRSEDNLPATCSLISDKKPPGISGNWTYSEGVKTVCSCDENASIRKTFKCNDGTKGSCAATEECFAVHSFDKASLEDGCQEGSTRNLRYGRHLSQNNSSGETESQNNSTGEMEVTDSSTEGESGNNQQTVDTAFDALNSPTGADLSQKSNLCFKRVREKSFVRQTLQIGEMRKVGSHVLSLVAVDEDVKVSWNKLNWRISGGNKDGKFGINENGVLYVAEQLDFETQDQYRLKVAVEDPGGHKQEVELDVEVHDENEPPTFDDMEFDLNENDIGVFVLKASDQGFSPLSSPPFFFCTSYHI